MNIAAKTGDARHAFFHSRLSDTDQEVQGTITRELGRQRDEIELIASENIVSRAVMDAQGSVMTNKYAEGYPGRRYYAAASTSTRPRIWPATGSGSFSIAPMPTCSPTPDRRPTRPCS